MDQEIWPVFSKCQASRQEAATLSCSNFSITHETCTLSLSVSSFAWAFQFLYFTRASTVLVICATVLTDKLREKDISIDICTLHGTRERKREREIVHRCHCSLSFFWFLALSTSPFHPSTAKNSFTPSNNLPFAYVVFISFSQWLLFFLSF